MQDNTDTNPTTPDVPDKTPPTWQWRWRPVERVPCKQFPKQEPIPLFHPASSVPGESKNARRKRLNKERRQRQCTEIKHVPRTRKRRARVTRRLQAMAEYRRLKREAKREQEVDQAAE